MKRFLLTIFLATMPVIAFADASDAKLNERYATMRARLGNDADAKEMLVATQRAWLSFRDKECRFRTSGVEGSAAPMVYSACIDDLTQKRAEEFQKYLNCPEGDLGCPIPRAE